MIRKSIIALSAVAALSTSSYAVSHDDMMKQIEMLKAQIAALESRLDQNANALKDNKTLLGTLKGDEKLEKRVSKLEKKVKKNAKKANQAKALANKDNIKWDVDFRTSVDNIKYTLTDGTTPKNNALLTNRLWLGMGYAPSENMLFKGTLSYNKAFGDSANHAQANTNPGYANFDWVTNENALDNTLKVKEAYWLYMNDTFLDTDMAWTASVGRRPSTDGLGITFREDQNRKSALSHTVNVEFDGASFKWNLDKITPLTGSWIKLCMGRGLTNAVPRFQQNGADYSSDDALHPNVDMAGFIFVPYDDGQYSIHTNYAKAMNVIGFKDMTDYGNGIFSDMGDLELMTAMVKVDGIGNEINDFLDDTTVFASFAQSKTHPSTNMPMIGSLDSQTGHSIWLGAQMPDPFSDDGRFGIEWNKGSKYWRSVTYGEDTMSGSKIAARGTAFEIYYNKPITKALSASLRYTDIKYDYTGSNGFFGIGSAPIDMATAKSDPATYGVHVEKSQDIRAYIRYRF